MTVTGRDLLLHLGYLNDLLIDLVNIAYWTSPLSFSGTCWWDWRCRLFAGKGNLLRFVGASAMIGALFRLPP